MMKKLLCMTLIATGICLAGYSQSGYKNAIGIRLAPGSYYDAFAFSFKTFVSNSGAIELNAGGGSRGRSYYLNNSYYNSRPFSFSVSGTYQHHFKIPVEGLRWFVGGGLIAYNVFSKDNKFEGFGSGFYPTGGIDYKFPAIPLNLTADFRPTIFFSKPDYYDSFNGANFGISARYVIGGR
ncbi:hypothetical protein [Agriterribacter humi]|jgi:hypothetical protein|uniref:hypothetical protein n=1 Tax=Agriterribacter humi TaxID=1104781 RepID=UPI001D026513|nr:hypothetical protein [Agriterribacter humi]